MPLRDIVNYIPVSDRVASSGQPDDDQFRLIRDAGFEVVINLAMPNSDDAIPEEGNIVAACGMSYVHIPVPFEKPADTQLAQFYAVMEAYQRHRVWAHCVVNYRVSAFLYLYFRVLKAQDEAQARRVMWPGWTPDAVWQAFIDRHLSPANDRCG